MHLDYHFSNTNSMLFRRENEQRMMLRGSATFYLFHEH